MAAFATALRAALLSASWSPGLNAVDGPDLTAFCSAIEAAINGTFLTAEGGYTVPLVNKTGSATVKGTVVAVSSGTASAFTAQTVEYDSIGVVYDAGIADGSSCRVVVAGIADVLLKDGTAGTRGYWVQADPVDGRASMLAMPPGGGIPQHDEHFKEVGHCMQTVGAGTNVLARCILHFN